MRIGYVGLGKMGYNMVLNLLEHGVEVVAWNRSAEPRQKLKKENPKAEVAEDLQSLIGNLQSPRIIWVMLTAGEPTSNMIQELSEKLSEGDLVIDGGNSFYKDTLKHAELFKEKGIHFMDVGTSGGPSGARNGACLMIGGEREDFKKQEELFKVIASEGAYQHLGNVGTGHFTKMVHNGIEYGMMQAIGEGFAILKHSDFNIDLQKAADIYQHRSVIESRLVGWLQEALDEDPTLSDISSKIGANGEGEWTVNTAGELGISVPVLSQSVEIRKQSAQVDENSPEGYRNKVISAMRGKFGGHEVSKKLKVKRKK